MLFFGSRIDDAVTSGLARLGKSWPTRLADAEARRGVPADLLSARIDMQQVAALIDDEFRSYPKDGKLIQRFFGADTWDIVRCEVRTR